jgi:competence protein ComEA
MQCIGVRLLEAALCMLMSVLPIFSFAAIELNTADQVALDGLNGLGPTKSKVILAERKNNGNFKNWADFEKRVKGVGQKSALKLSEAGLVINGRSFTESDAKASGVKSRPLNTK